MFHNNSCNNSPNNQRIISCTLAYPCSPRVSHPLCCDSVHGPPRASPPCDTPSCPLRSCSGPLPCGGARASLRDARDAPRAWPDLTFFLPDLLLD